jgi:hypothetical protein
MTYGNPCNQCDDAQKHECDKANNCLFGIKTITVSPITKLHQPTVSEIIKGVRHTIAEKQYSCGECEHIMEYLKGLVRE